MWIDNVGTTGIYRSFFLVLTHDLTPTHPTPHLEMFQTVTCFVSRMLTASHSCLPLISSFTGTVLRHTQEANCSLLLGVT